MAFGTDARHMVIAKKMIMRRTIYFNTRLVGVILLAAHLAACAMAWGRHEKARSGAPVAHKPNLLNSIVKERSLKNRFFASPLSPPTAMGMPPWKRSSRPFVMKLRKLAPTALSLLGER